MPTQAQSFAHFILDTLITLRNQQRMNERDLDYVQIMLTGAINALPQPRPLPLRLLQGDAPLSLTDLERAFRRISDDPRTKGIVLALRGVTMSAVDAQTLRGTIERFRETGKRVIVHAQHFGLIDYYLATAADQVLLQPNGDLMTTGLRADVTFMRDTLAAVGVALDVIAITPYKGALDQLARSEFSPEGREQLDWLLDSQFDTLIDGIAAGRGITPEAARAFIDNAPYIDHQALEHGYIDGLANEEDLPKLLESPHIIPWSEATKKLLEKARPRHEKYVTILPVSGLMIMGESTSPPNGLPIPLPFAGEELAGDRTITRQVRTIMQDENCAAVVLYIDSGGGSAQAAEAMCAALDELAQTRPLVAYMHSVAGSGGYYVAMPAQHIVAQRSTITGSIGVVMAKSIMEGLRDKLKINTFTLTRGANADIFSDRQPFTDDQRARMRSSIDAVYRRFVERVAESRKLTYEQVDAVGGGRVWTGVQALEHGLIDELGDLRAALKQARQRAHLPDDAPAVLFTGKAKQLPPQLAEAINPAAALLRRAQMLKAALFNGNALMIMPWRMD